MDGRTHGASYCGHGHVALKRGSGVGVEGDRRYENRNTITTGVDGTGKDSCKDPPAHK